MTAGVPQPLVHLPVHKHVLLGDRRRVHVGPVDGPTLPQTIARSRRCRPAPRAPICPPLASFAQPDWRYDLLEGGFGKGVQVLLQTGQDVLLFGYRKGEYSYRDTYAERDGESSPDKRK